MVISGKQGYSSLVCGGRCTFWNVAVQKDIEWTLDENRCFYLGEGIAYSRQDFGCFGCPAAPFEAENNGTTYENTEAPKENIREMQN